MFHPKTFVCDVCAAGNIFQKFKSAKRIQHRDVSSFEINWSLKAIKEWTSPHRSARLLLYLLLFYSAHPAGVCFTEKSTKLPSSLNASKTDKSIAKKYQERDYLLINSNQLQWVSQERFNTLFNANDWSPNQSFRFVFWFNCRKLSENFYY